MSAKIIAGVSGKTEPPAAAEMKKVTRQERIGLEPRQLFMVGDRNDPNYGVNFRVISILAGNENTHEPAQVKFQFQIPLGPGKEAQSLGYCYHCRARFNQGETLFIPATRQRDEQNTTTTLTEDAFWKKIWEANAFLVEA